MTSKNPLTKTAQVLVPEAAKIGIGTKNKAFTCCIKQYGILVDEEDPDLASAGNGKRHNRKFGLFDTFIVS